ncbi:MAG: tRNA (adenosine(37)-N6)-dimethylallyltransferase MiaA [Gammaproteobacteria bacterium]|nr:tRNA (adenosine(37)-N6)-dimethylallyltransferase MiaA [Gammaproteobacteria bacterium]
MARVFFLMGATATGKTDLALAIAERFDVEIISVDSALVYRGMDIGTAKPAPSVLQSVPHHLIDIIDPADAWSAWDFVQQSRQLVDRISARGRLPLLAGGTMLYYHAFEHGLNRLPEADDSLRRRLDREAREHGWPFMHAKLAAVDAASAERIKPTDAQRIQRALEVFEISGEPLSKLQQQASSGYPGSIEKMILAVNDRAALHRRIEQRFQQMLRQGLVEEVSALRQRGDLNLSMPSMRCVGYRQVWQHLDAEFSHQEMVDRALAATRQLAKRQITWLRKQPPELSFDCLNYRKGDIFRRIEAVISRP